MTRFRTTARRVGLTGLLVAAASLGSVTAAEAAPSGCDYFTGPVGVAVVCYGGSGEYRASTRCDKNNWPDYNRYGAWVRIGAISTATCDSSDEAFNRGHQTR